MKIYSIIYIKIYSKNYEKYTLIVYVNYLLKYD